jgi:hypothetical protein
MDRRTLIALLADGALAAACGGGSAPRTGPTAGGGDGSQAAARPSLAKPPKRVGEILVQGEASPASHGPFALDGRYTVRFEQIAPEDPSMDFAGQTAFVAMLDRRRQQAGAGNVAFGDFPYAIRLTPAAPG